MNKLKAQVEFVETLFTNFTLSVKDHIKRECEPRQPYCVSGTYMDKNCGKSALKRKITLIRQELLNLEKMIESE